MLKKRIIPSLLLKDGRMVKSMRFGAYRDTGYPLTAARIYDAQRADELIVLDISASQEGRAMLFDVIAKISEECFMPLCVGGGIRSVADIRHVIASGADKVAINTAAFEVEGCIEEAAQKFGRSTIVVSIDYKKNALGENEVYVCGGKKGIGESPLSWAKKVERRGAGEIFLTCIDRDGTMDGLDIPTLQTIVDAVSIPVIASGGVGSLEDFKQGMEEGGAAAVSAASIFHFTDQSPIKARKYLVDRGINVRA